MSTLLSLRKLQLIDVFRLSQEIKCFNYDFMQWNLLLRKALFQRYTKCQWDW